MRSTFELKHLNNNIPKSPNKANKWPCSKIRNPLCFKLSRGAWIPTSSFRCSAVGATAQALQASTQKITKTRHRFFLRSRCMHKVNPKQFNGLSELSPRCRHRARYPSWLPHVRNFSDQIGQSSPTWKSIQQWENGSGYRFKGSTWHKPFQVTVARWICDPLRRATRKRRAVRPSSGPLQTPEKLPEYQHDTNSAIRFVAQTETCLLDKVLKLMKIGLEWSTARRIQVRKWIYTKSRASNLMCIHASVRFAMWHDDSM